MTGLLTALQFLTVIPLETKYTDEKKLSAATVYFPFAGLLLGLVLAAMSTLMSSFNVEGFVANSILVVTLVVLTGGMHLDGLADTFDAIASGKNKEEMLRIMRDPHIGVMGVLSIISVLLLKISFLSMIHVSLRPLALILSCTLSRWALVYAISFFPYARREGKAGIFFENRHISTFLLASSITLIVAFAALKGLGVLLFFSVMLVTFLMSSGSKKILGGLTGDVLGSLCELNELAVLLLISIFIKIRCF